MKRRWLLLGLVLLLGMLLLPAVRWRLIGWLGDEVFYDGRPTSYWESELRGIVAMEGISHFPHLSFHPAPFSFNGDSAAVPVLLELLKSEHVHVRIQACMNVRDIGPGARLAIPELQSIAMNGKSRWEYLHALDALRAIDPAAAQAIPERDINKLAWTTDWRK